VSTTDTPALPRAALTIKEFCERHGFSRGQYYRLKRAGCAPAELRFGGSKLVLITEESAREWRERHTQPAA
jgi:predicted DNA-binding transcriptional regulator AlpA